MLVWSKFELYVLEGGLWEVWEGNMWEVWVWEWEGREGWREGGEAMRPGRVAVVPVLPEFDP